MAAKLTRLTHKVAIQLHLVPDSLPFAVLAPGGQSGNFWIHPRITRTFILLLAYKKAFMFDDVEGYKWSM